MRDTATEHICRNCGSPYYDKAKGRRSKGFCSKKCADSYRLKNKPPKYTKICEHCGKEFKTNNKRQKFCCRRCVEHISDGRTVYKKTCLYCGTEFETIYKNHQYCSAACGSRDYGEKRRGHYYCEFCGKERYSDHPNRNRYCSRECASAAKRLESETKRIELERESIKAHTKICPFCGEKFIANILFQKYCSYACQYEDTKFRKRNKWADNFVPKQFVCCECGKKVTTVVGSPRRAYCSDECQNRAVSRSYNIKRKEQMQKAFVEPVSLIDVYKSANGRCSICGLTVPMDTEPSGIWNATIDHKIPLSKGGLHMMSNCQLAHRLCNSFKGDTTEDFHIDWLKKINEDPERWGDTLKQLFEQTGGYNGYEIGDANCA